MSLCIYWIHKKTKFCQTNNRVPHNKIGNLVCTLLTSSDQVLHETPDNNKIIKKVVVFVITRAIFLVLKIQVWLVLNKHRQLKTKRSGRFCFILRWTCTVSVKVDAATRRQCIHNGGGVNISYKSCVFAMCEILLLQNKKKILIGQFILL